MRVASESWEGHFDGHPERGGVPTTPAVFLARHASHLAEPFMARDAEGAAQRLAFLFMGAPGSGKSKLPDFCTDERGAADCVLIDPDVYKAALPEYAGGAGAAVVHEESSWIARQVRNSCIGRRCSLMNDAVGASPGKYADVVRRLKANNFRVELLCVHSLEVDALLDRVARRAAKNGRVVPESVLRHAHAQVPETFRILSGGVDAAFLFDAASGELAWEQISGRVQVHLADFVREFSGASGWHTF